MPVMCGETGGATYLKKNTGPHLIHRLPLGLLRQGAEHANVEVGDGDAHLALAERLQNLRVEIAEDALAVGDQELAARAGRFLRKSFVRYGRNGCETFRKRQKHVFFRLFVFVASWKQTVGGGGGGG